MDKLVTFFGYISNYVIPSRRNGNTDAARGPSVKKSHKNQGDSTESGSTCTNGGLTAAVSGETKLNRSRASAFTERNLHTLRGEVRGIKSPQSRYPTLPNNPAEQPAQVSDSRGNGPSVLPPVDANYSSSKTLGNNDKLAGTRFQRTNNSSTGAALPTVRNHPGEFLSKEATHQGREKRSNSRDLRKDKGLPNIFSNVGKSFVETNQLAVFDRASFRKKPTCPKEPVIPVEQPAMQGGSIQENDGQSRMEVAPKAKGRKKKKRKTKRRDERHAGNDECWNEQRDGVKECDVGTAYQVKQKLTEKTAAKDVEVGKESNWSRQRPGTAFGRWIKKRSNTVAPAPLHDSITNLTDCSQKQEKGSLPNEERVTEDSSDRHGLCPSASPHVRTVFVSECQENISILMPKETPHKTPEMVICDESVHEQAKENANSSLKTAEHVQTNVAESRIEEKPIGEKVAPPCPSKPQERTLLAKAKEQMPVEKVALPYPVKRDLLKETVENISLAALNDNRKQQPKVAMTRKKELKGGKLNRTDAHIRTQQVAASAEDSTASNEGFVGLLESWLDLCDVLPDAPVLDEASTLKPYKTVTVKQRADKTLEKVSSDDSAAVSASRRHDTAKFDADRSARHSNLGARRLPRLDDSDFQDCATFEINDGIVSGVPINAAASKATADPMFPAIGRNQATRRLTLIPTSEQCASTSQATNEKPIWNGGKPCLPAIKSERKQMAADFLEKHRKKLKQEMDDAFGSWVEENEPDEMKSILERPLTAKLPNYPAHWERLPDRPPPGRGGQGYCLGVLWKKPDKSFLSKSSAEDLTSLKEEEPRVFQRAVNRPKTPQTSLQLFDNFPFPSYVSKEEEPSAWCRTLRVRRRSPSAMANDHVDIEDVEDFL